MKNKMWFIVAVIGLIAVIAVIVIHNNSTANEVTQTSPEPSAVAEPASTETLEAETETVIGEIPEVNVSGNASEVPEFDPEGEPIPEVTPNTSTEYTPSENELPLMPMPSEDLEF